MKPSTSTSGTAKPQEPAQGVASSPPAQLESLPAGSKIKQIVVAGKTILPGKK